MAAPPSRKKTAPRETWTESEKALLGSVVAVVLVLAGLLWAKAVGASWLEAADSPRIDGNAPHWMKPEVVRATTEDGAVVKARVVVDAPEADTRAWIGRRSQQVNLLMQISVAEHDHSQGSGSERVQRLAEDMQERLNVYLEKHQVPPVRELVIQDLVVSKP